MKDRFIQAIKGRFSKVFSYAILVLVALMVFSMVRNIGRVLSIRKEVEKERLKIEKIEKENERIQADITKAQGTEFVEKQVRDKLGLVKEGEIIIVLPEEEIVKKLAPKVIFEDDYLPDPNWKRWLKLFF